MTERHTQGNVCWEGTERFFNFVMKFYNYRIIQSRTGPNIMIGIQVMIVYILNLKKLSFSGPVWRTTSKMYSRFYKMDSRFDEEVQ